MQHGQQKIQIADGSLLEKNTISQKLFDQIQPDGLPHHLLS